MWIEGAEDSPESVEIEVVWGHEEAGEDGEALGRSVGVEMPGYSPPGRTKTWRQCA